MSARMHRPALHPEPRQLSFSFVFRPTEAVVATVDAQGTASPRHRERLIKPERERIVKKRPK
jgi:hypothetical protein